MPTRRGELWRFKASWLRLQRIREGSRNFLCRHWYVCSRLWITPLFSTLKLNYNQNEKIWICFLLSVYCLFKSFWAASLAARAAASGLMLERRSSSRVTTISRPIDWTISVGLYSNSTSPLIESYFMEFFKTIFESIWKLIFVSKKVPVSSRTVVLTMTSVTQYGSQLDEGRLSSK